MGRIFSHAGLHDLAGLGNEEAAGVGAEERDFVRIEAWGVMRGVGRDRPLDLAHAARAAERVHDALGFVVGADEFFPVLVWLVLHATPPRVISEISYISRYRNPERLRGVSGCYFTHLRAAIAFLETAARGSDPCKAMPPSSADTDGEDGGYLSLLHGAAIEEDGADNDGTPAGDAVLHNGSTMTGAAPCRSVDGPGGTFSSYTYFDRAADWLFGGAAQPLTLKADEAGPSRADAPSAGQSACVCADDAVPSVPQLPARAAKVGSIFGGVGMVDSASALGNLDEWERRTRPEMVSQAPRVTEGTPRNSSAPIADVNRDPHRDAHTSRITLTGTRVANAEPSLDGEASAAQLLGFY